MVASSRFEPFGSDAREEAGCGAVVEGWRRGECDEFQIDLDGMALIGANVSALRIVGEALLVTGGHEMGELLS